MADTSAPAIGRKTLRLPAQPSLRLSPVHEYARAYALRMARRLAGRAALRRAELRARAYSVIASDRLTRGGAT